MGWKRHLSHLSTDSITKQVPLFQFNVFLFSLFELFALFHPPIDCVSLINRQPKRYNALMTPRTKIGLTGKTSIVLNKLFTDHGNNRSIPFKSNAGPGD